MITMIDVTKFTYSKLLNEHSLFILPLPKVGMSYFTTSTNFFSQVKKCQLHMDLVMLI
jgi:hypothetical protein